LDGDGGVLEGDGGEQEVFGGGELFGFHHGEDSLEPPRTLSRTC
jgi:hypothetical protein